MSVFGEHLFWPVERWRELQSARLAAHVAHAATSPLYRDLHLAPDALLHQLPLTTKDGLAAAGKSAWAIAPHQAGEWVCTSGTTGRPVDVPLTAADLERLAENEAAALSLAGLRENDLLLLAVGMDRMFVAGLAYYLGARKIGASVARLGAMAGAGGNTLRDLVHRLAATDQRAFVMAVPSYLSAMEPVAPRTLAGVITIGEATRLADGTPTPLAARIAQRLAAPVLSTYALTETCATFAEGPACIGGHLNPALATAEILRPDSTEPVPDGEIGEVVVTPLGVEGMPLLRFRTGDMAWLRTAPCPCGRTTPRLGPIVGRRQQLLKIRGVSVYPTAIVEAVRGVHIDGRDTLIECCVVADAAGDSAGEGDHVVVYLEGDPAHVGTGLLKRAVEARLRALLRVVPELRIVSPHEIQELQLGGGRKLRRFVDKRPTSVNSSSG